MRRTIATVGVMLGVGAAGCQAVIGLHDYVVDGTGGGGTGGQTTGGTGGTGGAVTGGTGGATTGGTGGAGGQTPLSCTPSGSVFDVFPSSSDEPDSDRVFLLSTPGALPPRVHAVHTFDSGTGHLSVRTMKSIGMLTSEVGWDMPAGAWSFQQGRLDQSHVSVQGHVTTASGPTIGEVQFALDNEQQVQSNPLPEFVDFPAPIDCPALDTATIKEVGFASEGANTHFTATFDNCVNGVRRLYHYTPALGLTKLREGTMDDASLVLVNHVRNGDQDLLVFFDGQDAAISGGSTISDLQVVRPVTLGKVDQNLSVPLAVAPVETSSFAFWWLIPQKGPAVPADLYGGVVDGAALDQAGKNETYDLLHTYLSFDAASKWSRPSIGMKNIAVAEMAYDFSEIRLSILGKNGKTVLLDQSVEKGAAGAYLDASAAYFGQDILIVSWTVKDGTTRYYRAQAFTCK